MNDLMLSSLYEDANALEHHGIMGMKWGVRRYQPYPSDYDGDGVYKGKAPKKSFREKRAEQKRQKEAKEYAEKYLSAKMAYGEGSGTRRKLIKAELEKKFQDEKFKEEFDNQLALLDTEAYAKKAVSERNIADAKAKAKKVTKASMNVAMNSAAFTASATNGLYIFSKLI